MNTAGGSAAFGRWAGQHIKTSVGAQITTIILGCLIFVDDYFNCLTVGSVMRPITDKHNVSSAKLAYYNRFNCSSSMYNRTNIILGSCSNWICSW